MPRFRTISPPLRSVAALRGRPLAIPSRPPTTASARRGLAFQRRVGKELSRLLSPHPFLLFRPGPWFSYSDSKGPGFCQPDFLIHRLGSSPGLLLVETKLAYRPEAWVQLSRLYAPVVGHLHPHTPLALAQVCGVYSGEPLPSPCLRLGQLTELSPWPQAPFLFLHLPLL